MSSRSFISVVAFLAAVFALGGCGVKKVPSRIVDAAMAPNLEITSPREGEEVIIDDSWRVMITTKEERRAPGAIMTGNWRLLEWSSLAHGGRWPGNSTIFQLNIPQGVEGKVELIMQLNEGDRVVERRRYFSIRWPRVSHVEIKRSLVRVSFPPGEEARGARVRFRTHPDTEGINLDKLTFGPMDTESAKACVGNIKTITLEYLDFQGRTNMVNAPTTHDCKASFRFPGDRMPYVGRDGKNELRVSVQTNQRYEGGHLGSFRLGLVPEEFQAIGIGTGHLIREVRPGQVLFHITILEPPPRS